MTTETGKIRMYSSDRKFGFVLSDSGNSLFFHARSFNVPNWSKLVICEGTKVRFVRDTGPKGEFCKSIELA